MKHIPYYIMTAALAIFVGCGNNSNHSHSYEAEEHEVQADAAGLEIETVQPASFNAVIRTSG